MAQTFNLTANGTTPALTIKGKLNVGVFGTFGGGSVAIELSYDGTNWFAATNALGDPAVISAAQAVNVEVGTADVRFVLSGATSPDLDINITGVLRTSKL